MSKKTDTKNIKRGIEPQAERPNAKKKKPVIKPWIVMYRPTKKSGLFGGMDWELHRCETKEQAEQQIEKEKRAGLQGQFWLSIKISTARKTHAKNAR